MIVSSLTSLPNCSGLCIVEDEMAKSEVSCSLGGAEAPHCCEITFSLMNILAWIGIGVRDTPACVEVDCMVKFAR